MKAALLLASLLFFLAVNAQDTNTSFSENFSTNSNQWPINTDGGATYKLRDGKYVMENTNGKSIVVTIPMKDLSSTYTLSAACTHTSGISNNNFGLYFGSLDNANGYVFGISKSGSYIVFRNVNKQPEILIKWTEHSSIKKEEGAKNSLKIKADGSNFEFYINDTYVNSLSGYKPNGSRIGFIVSDNQKVEFDDLLVQSGSYSDINKFLDTYSKTSNDFDLFDFLDLAVGEKELLHDKFSTADGWVFDKNEFAISDGKLSSKSIAGKIYTAGKIVPVNQQKDYSVAIHTQHFAGLKNYGYGLRLSDNSNNVQFRISQNGMYNIVAGDAKLVPWTTTAYVNKTDLASNKLTIEKTEGRMKFSLNDHLLYTYTSAPSFSPFWVQPLVDEAQTIVFTDLMIKGSSPLSNTTTTQTTTEKKTMIEELPVDINDKEKPMGMVFFDGFTQVPNTHWAFDSLRTKIQYGKLTIHSLKDTFSSASHYEALETKSDFQAIVETKHISGIDNYGYGLQLMGGQTVLTFQITQNGFFQVLDGTKMVVQWTKNSALKNGAGEANKLSIKKHAAYIEFYCNDTLLYKYDTAPAFGKFYIILSAMDDQTVEFDNIELDGTNSDPIDWG